MNVTKFNVDPDKGAATAIDNHGQAIATILYETADPCGLNVRWAESSVPGTATPLLKKIVQVEEPDFIRMTPTTWSGAGWARKLVREYKQGRLPLVVWDFYGDQYEVTWTDGRKPSEDKLGKFINSTDPDIRRNSGPEFVQVTIQTIAGQRRSWAKVMRRGKLVIYQCLDREGAKTGEVFVAKPGEAVEKPARMSLKYGTFEIAENPARAYTDKFLPSGGS